MTSTGRAITSRRSVLGFALMGAATLLAACSQAAPTPAPTAAAAPQSASAVKIKVNTLVDVPELKPVFEKIVNEFNTAQGGKIQAELLQATQQDWQVNLVAAITAGSPPDLD